MRCTLQTLGARSAGEPRHRLRHSCPLHSPQSVVNLGLPQFAGSSGRGRHDCSTAHHRRARALGLRTGRELDLAVAGADVVGTSLHHLFDDGTFAVAVPSDSAIAATVVAAGSAGMPALLELTDQAPLPLREPVRSLVWVRGNVVAASDREARGIVDVIASRIPDPALLDIRTDMRLRTEPGSVLLCLTVESVVVADSTGAESVDVSALLSARPDPFCALGRDGSPISTTTTAIWSSGWPGGCH